METELKSMNPNLEPNHNNNHQTDPNRDDRPLLKSDSNNNTSNHRHHNSSTTGESIEELEKKYAAYVRHDVYGPMGRGELPVAEKLLLGIAFVTLVPIRVLVALGMIALYYVICRVCTMFWRTESGGGEEEVVEEGFERIGGWRRSVIVRSGRFLSRALLFVIGFYWIKESYRDVDGIRQPHKNSTQVWCCGRVMLC